MERGASDRGSQMIGQSLREDLVFRDEILPAEEPTTSARRDVGQEKVQSGESLVVTMIEDHVRQLVQHELLPMKCRVAPRMEHEILAVGHQPQCTDAVMIVEIREFDDAERALSATLQCVDEIVEREGVTEGEVSNGRRYGPFDVHSVVTSLRRGSAVSFRSRRRGLPTCASFPRPGID